ncbi:maleylpyruvate isomerase family mycothiol-dependent enzyme [Actinomycetospora cinnamomea]|uniref:Uncharacterized protein (TIGR03083 family) n=1 Tax=Actinomycetospora cinnamomea TaxID=663609 RepID=A0A2U1EBK6_9PSEU|nr:maleylpyruvate isomerase family mycothiol-dependent enzyme [Actinomycetospora cinnamomea]PVY97277.1 uncharacterized protein (TIGR03083 family) [Actinomycetospora cinnamomea]
MDEIAEWTRAQERVIALVAGLPAARAATTVPACPDWTVRDLLSHMVGLGADVVAGNEPDDHNAAWTARQVDARRDRDVDALVAEWRALTGPLQSWMAEHGTRPLGDVTIHEQDLRGALGEPGAQDTPATAAMRERFAGRLGARLDPELPPIALVGPGWSWCSRGEPTDAPVELRASDFDLARALVTRRSAAQLGAWTVRGDVGPYLDAFAILGPLPERDLAE